MRAGYLIIGILLGILVTCNRAVYVFEAMQHQWDKEVLAFSLTGYSEGWTRGRDYTLKLYYWQYMDCVDELNRMGKGKK